MSFTGKFVLLEGKTDAVTAKFVGVFARKAVFFEDGKFLYSCGAFGCVLHHFKIVDDEIRYGARTYTKITSPEQLASQPIDGWFILTGAEDVVLIRND